MRTVGVYLLIFLAVFLLTYVFFPARNFAADKRQDRVIQVPFQDYEGLIRV